ncbi:MAG TPA: aspartate aminotransferase family protein [Steroidobacteraceae bacterium]|nr:aspartate aminotransferase family protein [Steroidobacteraceae bacterium]
MAEPGLIDFEASHVFERDASLPPRLVAACDGCWVTDSAGRRYLDGSGGAIVSGFGHAHPTIVAAIRRQLDAGILDTNSMFFHTVQQEELARHLCELSGGHLPRSIFCNSGTEAVESAMKLARQYHVERGDARRVHFVSRRSSYHGNTMGALSLSDQSRRPLFGPYTFPAEQVPAYFPYRYQAPGESDDAYALRCADALETAIQHLGPGTVAGFVVETVVGSSLGVMPTPPVYLERVREICDRHGVLLILDEVMCGAGRTGTFFAYEQEPVKPDIVTLAKGLSGGHVPLSAICCTEPIYRAIREGSHKLALTHTYLAHPLACAAGVGVMEIVRGTDLLQGVKGKGDLLLEMLRARFAAHPHVDFIRGRGLFTGLELVADRARRSAYPASEYIFRKVRRRAFDLGLICWAATGTAEDGGDFVMLAPPYIVSEAELEQVVALIGRAIDDVLG